MRRLLEGYDDMPPDQRAAVISAVRKLLPREGLGLLARLTRFEEDELLSKQAALAILGLQPPASTEEQQARRQTVLESLGTSRRTAVQWLRGYVRSVADPVAEVPRFSEWVEREKELLQHFSADTTEEVVDQLSRLTIDLMLRADQRELALQQMRALVLGGQPDAEATLTWVDWLMERSAWSVVEELAAAQRDVFAGDALLLYRLAEAREHLGDSAAAARTAEQAFAAKAGRLERHQEGLRHTRVAPVAFLFEQAPGEEAVALRRAGPYPGG